jgi:hypothetical protein
VPEKLVKTKIATKNSKTRTKQATTSRFILLFPFLAPCLHTGKIHSKLAQAEQQQLSLIIALHSIKIFFYPLWLPRENQKEN